MSTVSKSSPSVLSACSPSPSSNLGAYLQPSRLNSSARAPSPSGLNIADIETQFAEKARNMRLSMHSDLSRLSMDTSLSLNTEYHGPIIPPNSDKCLRRRTLVVCFDGTGDQFDLDNSNVIEFFSVLKKGDRKRQLVYYQSGIGTYSVPQVATPMYSRLSKTLDLMFANNLNHHVMSGYSFLMQNYKDGDKICIFGFSRGAYTARALAGMIHKVGLLPAGNEQQVPFAYKMYKSDNELGWKQSVAFKKTFSMDVDIDFVGVWDTVASVGLLPTTLPFTKSNTAIKVFRHALSLDEHRAKFKPSIYEHITAEEAKRGDFTPPPTRRSSPTVTRGRRKEKTTTKDVVVVKERKKTRSASKTQDADSDVKLEDADTKVTRTTTVTKMISASSDERRSDSGSRSRAILGSIRRSARGVSDTFQGVVERVSLDREKSKSKDDDKEKQDLSPDSERDQLEQMFLDRSRPTDVLEVWFAGCHCDVGGGSVPNTTANSLARIPLRWMIRECFLARTGIQFEADRLRELGLEPATLYPKVMKPPHPVSLDSPIQIEVPLPTPPQVSYPFPSDSTHTSGSIHKQEISVSAENTAEDDGAQGMEKAVTVVKTEDTDIATTTHTQESSSAQDQDMTPEHGRANNISLDATLVNFDGDSIEAPDVQIERASVISEKMSHTSEGHEHDALHSVPNLASPQRRDSGLKPVPGPSVSVSPAGRRRSPQLNFMTLEAQQDVHDARSDVYDQLKLSKWWWVLEFIPFRERVQRKDGTWRKKWSINRGRARVVPQEEPLIVHRSVKMRMEAKDLNYKPRVRFDKEPIWVD